MLGLLVSYTACALAITIGIVYPYVGLLVYVAFAIVKPAEMWFWSLSGSQLSVIAFFGLSVGWLLRGLGDWRLRYAWLPVWSLLLFWMWSWLSWCNSTSTLSIPELPGASSQTVIVDEDRALENLVHLGKIVFPCLLGITLLDSEKKVQGLLYTLIFAQGYVAWEMNLAYLVEGYNRIRIEGFAGLDNNSIAVSMVACCGPAYILAWRSRSLWLKLLCAICAFLIAHAILLSFSRGGMIALVISVATGLVVIREQWPKCTLFLVVALATISLCGPEVRDRFLSIFAPAEELDPAARSRLELWKDCLDVVMKFPLCGIGPENWPRAAALYGWPEGKEAHSLWLQTAAEIGIPGVVAILMYYLLTGYRLHRLELSSNVLQSVRESVLMGLGGFIIAAQFVSLELLETPYYLALCGMGALRYAYKVSNSGAP